MSAWAPDPVVDAYEVDILSSEFDSFLKNFVLNWN